MGKKFIGICGHFDRSIGENGQTLKTICLYNELKKVYGEDEIIKASTHIWKKKPLRFFFQIINLCIKTKNIIILPDSNGLKVMSPIFYFLSKIFKNRLYYCVIGAWLPNLLLKKKGLKKILLRFDGIFVETNTLQNSLVDMGFKNIDIIKNFKQINKVSSTDINNYTNDILSICFFSRVQKEKGIEDAIMQIMKYNCSTNNLKIKLDIYGKIDNNYSDYFYKIINEYSEYIQYKGEIEAFSSVETISKYHYQIFPTRYKTEGIPGSIIDSFFSGVPVISSKWNSCYDILSDGENSILFEIHNVDDLYNKLVYATNIDFNDYMNMRKNSLNSANNYIPSNCIKVIIDKIEMKKEN